MTVSSIVDIRELDLTDPQTFLRHDMARVWRHARKSSPVFRHAETDGRPAFWVVATHRDCIAIYRDARRFTTERGNMLATLLHGGDPAGGRMVSVTDGARHRDLRTVIHQGFSARALDHLTDRIQQYATELLIGVTGTGPFDFAADVAARVPMNTICDLLGVPATEREYLFGLNKRAVSSDHPDQPTLASRLARNELLQYLTELAYNRRERPADDFVSVLATAHAGGEPLSTNDIALNCYSLLLGGDGTSRLSMINAVRAFTSHPDQWRRLRDGEVDLDTATEEVVRWATPIMHIGRTTCEDVEIGGVRIGAGDIVTLWNSSANRDEAAFAEPDRFDLARSPNKHLAFGFGTHFCVGVHLARAEIRAVLSALRELVDEITPTAQARPIYSNVITGFSALPVAFTAATR